MTAMQSRLLFVVTSFGLLGGASAQEVWRPIASPGVGVEVRTERFDRGPGFSLNYDFRGQAGFVLAEQKFAQDLPPNFEFSFWIRADGPQNDFEFKLMDPTGNSVWWVKKAAWTWPRTWTRMVIRRSQLVYAWGPDRTLFPRSGSLQFGVAANAGGKGRVQIADFEYRELPPTAPFSTEIKRGTGPMSERIGLKGLQAVGGLKFSGLRKGQRVTVTTPDRSQVYALGPATTGTIYLPTPELETEALQVESDQGTRHLKITPLPSTFSTYPYLVWESIAKDQPRGLYPLHLLGKQSFFTVVGAKNSNHEGLINEHGMVELRRMGPSLEPFLFANGKRVDWSNVRSEARLVDGALPIPSVVWHGPVLLTTEAIAPEGTSDQLSIQYRLHNTTQQRQRGALLVALRPLQVNPSWQSLNLNPLIAPIRSIRLQRGVARLDDGWTIAPVETVRHVGATRRAEGDLVPFLNSGTVPKHESLDCPDGDISALWRIPYDLAPGQSRAVTFRAFGPGQRPTTKDHATTLRKESERIWRGVLRPERLNLGGSGKVWADTLMANLAYIMIHRDGPMIHPGSRTYQRSWIRDGALTCTALLQFGINEPVKEFIDWFSTGIREDGWVPCVLDSRGPDPLAEHDSHGQFIYLLATYHRFTGDTATVRRHYPTIQRIVGMIAKLRAERSTDRYRNATGIERGFYGLFPESASHEGYMDHHRHSFWDDFFGVKGLRDASYLASVMGDQAFEQQSDAMAEDFEKRFVESIEFTQKFHGINYIAGCVELGDFDATSTAIGVYPCGGLRYVPRKHFDATFERYWKFFTDREAGRIQWRDYTPYEVRVLSAMVLMDQPERAHHMMNWFLRDLRPLGWKHWAEVGYLDAEPGRWIGDMPHTWVGSEFIKALRLMLVHERESDGVLVFAAGVKPSWMTGEVGLRAVDLPTHYGPVNLTGTLRGTKAVFNVSGTLRDSVPIALRLPWSRGIRSIHLNGKAVSASNQEISIPQLPARIEVTLDSAPTKP